MKLGGAVEGLFENQGTKTCRAWRTLHIGTDADTREIVTATLTGNDASDASQVGPLLDQVPGPLASFTADDAYDWDSVYNEVAAPPRCCRGRAAARQRRAEQHGRDRAHATRPPPAVLGGTGPHRWQAASGYNGRALVETDVSRFKRVIGDGLRPHTDRRRATEVGIAVGALNRMLDLRRPEYVRTT